MTIPHCIPAARRAAIAVVVVVLALAPPASAQIFRTSLPTGTRVRVLDRIGGERFTGTVLRLTPDTLGVALGGGSTLLNLPTSRLASLEVSEGRERGQSAWRGAGIGLVAGSLIGAVSMRGEGTPGDVGALVGLMVGGLLGAGSGIVVGAITAPERWRRVSLPGSDR
jgi:hypothetical protein